MKFWGKKHTTFHIYVFNQPQIKNIFFNSRKFQKAKLEFDLCLQLLT